MNVNTSSARARCTPRGHVCSKTFSLNTVWALDASMIAQIFIQSVNNTAPESRPCFLCVKKEKKSNDHGDPMVPRMPRYLLVWWFSLPELHGGPSDSEAAARSTTRCLGSTWCPLQSHPPACRDAGHSAGRVTRYGVGICAEFRLPAWNTVWFDLPACLSRRLCRASLGNLRHV